MKILAESHFLVFFFYKKKNKSVYRVVLPPSLKIVTLGYVHVSLTNQIAALGFLSRTNHITVFGYLVPITALEYCFLANDFM